MICSLSGETPEEPVVSIKSGHVFEKRLIHKWLQSNDNCPITSEPLTENDLIQVKVSEKTVPRPTTATSIPGMLALFQNEWDALMLETFSLKQQLHNVKQELSQALYQYDASCRVIARLLKERDDAREALANYRAQVAEQKVSTAQPMEISQENDIPDDLKSKMKQKHSELLKERKKRVVPETLAPEDTIKEYTCLDSNNIHKASAPGVLCVDIHPNQKDVLTGGVDGQVIMFNRETRKIVSSFNAHNKSVHAVLFHPERELILSASADGTAKVWKDNQVAHTVKIHKNEVTSCALQATGDLWATSSLDKSWALHDFDSSSCVVQQYADSGITCASFHPDGLLLGTGEENSILHIWDMRRPQKPVASFEDHQGKILDLTFSENGIFLASSAEDNSVKIWDLRKVTSVHSIDIENSSARAVAFDYSGHYTAVGVGQDLRIYSGKTFEYVTSLKGHTSQITDIKWGHDANWLASTSMDRSLKFWGTKQEIKKEIKQEIKQEGGKKGQKRKA